SPCPSGWRSHCRRGRQDHLYQRPQQWKLVWAALTSCSHHTSSYTPFLGAGNPLGGSEEGPPTHANAPTHLARTSNRRRPPGTGDVTRHFPTLRRLGNRAAPPATALARPAAHLSLS